MRISDWSSDVCSSDLALPRSRIVEVPDRGVRAREVRRTKDKDRKDRTRRRSAGEIPPGASYRQCAHPTGGGALRARALDLPRAASQGGTGRGARSEEHTSELQSLMRISYAVFFLKKKQETKDEVQENVIT